MERKTGVNGKAIVSIVLGGLSFITPLMGALLAIVGVFAARVAKKEIVKTDRRVRDIELATAGFMICIVGMIYQIYHIFNFFIFFR